MKGYESERRYVGVGVLGSFSSGGEGWLMIDDHIATRKCRQVLDLFKIVGLLEFSRLYQYFLNKRHVTASCKMLMTISLTFFKSKRQNMKNMYKTKLIRCSACYDQLLFLVNKISIRNSIRYAEHALHIHTH